MTIHTPITIRRMQRRLDRQRQHRERDCAVVNHVLGQMRGGQALHLSFDRTCGAAWSLSNGAHVDDKIARLVIQHSDVVGVDGALLDDALAQTWRIIEN